MRSISFEEATAVGGGMIGAGPGGYLLAAGDTTQRYDDGSSLTTNSSGNVVRLTLFYGYERSAHAASFC
jgi:galactokinase/mevalonate kinase-like predicted kinase